MYSRIGSGISVYTEGQSALMACTCLVCIETHDPGCGCLKPHGKDQATDPD